MSDETHVDDVNDKRSIDEPDRATPAPEPPEPLPPPEPPETRPRPNRSRRLLELAEAEFGENLTDADRKLFRAVANGVPADFSDPDPAKNDPAKAHEWGAERVIQAERIRWLCTDPEARREVLPHDGITIKGARIEGMLRLSGCVIEGQLVMVGCRLTDELRLDDASLAFLVMEGTQATSIFAPRSTIARGILLRNGFHSSEGIDFSRADVGGDFDCSQAVLHSKAKPALNAAGITIEGALFLQRTSTNGGEIRLTSARIRSSLECACAMLNNGGQATLVADRVAIGGTVFLREGFASIGPVRLPGAAIDGSFDCSGGMIFAPTGLALVLDGSRIGDDVLLDDGFAATGEVRMCNVHVAGSLFCENAKFENQQGRALYADSIQVDAGMFVRNGTRIVGNVNLPGARITGWFIWHGVKEPLKYVLDLRGAHVGTLWDQEKSWPRQVHLDGFTYDRIHHEAPTEAETRLKKWLDLQPKDQYFPQPYNQLARVLQEMGHEADARKVHFAKVNDSQRLATLGAWWRRPWHYLLRYTIGNGYYPERALWWIMGIVLAGTIIFGWADRSDRMVAAQGDTTAKVAFNPFVYSLDAFVPLIDLHQVEHRLPPAGWVRAYFWIHILAGWSLTTLLVVGFTGLVRK